jgi:uncharacterized membrane protein
MSLKWKVIIFFVLHLVGIIGFTIRQYEPLFQQFIPIHLLVITVVMCFDKHIFNNQLIIFIFIAICIGFGGEVLGVKTHYLFGYYTYKNLLGPELFEVPLIIGILWFSTAYASNQVAMKLFHQYQWVSIPTAALIMVFFDFMIEPFAIRYGLWTWRDINVPQYNYICWFGVGLVLSLIYQKLVKDSTNEAAPYFLISQIIFFILLRYSTLMM